MKAPRLRTIALFLAAIAASIATPLLLAIPANKHPLRYKLTWYRLPTGALWRGASAPGYAAVAIYAGDRASGDQSPRWATQLPAKDLPAWFTHSADGIQENRERRQDTYAVEAFGWPAPALARTLLLTPYGWAERGGPAPTAPGKVGPLSRPSEILWRGMLLNTAVFAAIFLTPPLLFSAARRSIRRRRGLCPHCAYDRRGLPTPTAPCPECGTTPRGATA